MVDPRVSEHAKIVVNYSCKVKRNDFVIISATPEAHDLVVALASELGKAGARFMVVDTDDYVHRAYVLAAGDETLSTLLPPQVVNLFREADVFINVGALSSSNTQEMSDIPPQKLMTVARSMGPLSEAMAGKRWNLTLHPTKALAQDGKMSYEAYCDFVYSAIIRDWPKFETEMKVLSERMARAKNVRVVGKDTDIPFGRGEASEGQRGGPQHAQRGGIRLPRRHRCQRGRLLRPPRDISVA